MTIIFIFFLIISFILALKKPTYFVIYYLLASTKFLGFFDVEYYFVLGGFGLGMPMLNITTFIVSFFIYDWYKVPKKYLKFLSVFILFVTYGILHPIILGYETVFQALIASKEFWTISILFYMVTHRKKINIYLLLKSIKYIGLYLAFVYTVYFFLNLAPPFYNEGDHLRGFFPTYMSLALFIYYSEFQNHKIKWKNFTVVGMFLLLGLILAGHFALVLGTLFSLIVLYLFYNKNNFSIKVFVVRGFSILSITIIFLIAFSDIRNNLINQYEKIVTGTDVALTSREIYNKFRWKALSERPMGGYGFIHKSSFITTKFRTIENNRFAEHLGVIDSGYLDLLIKFGYIGTALYLLFWMSNIFTVLLKPKKYHIIQLSMGAYLLQYFLVNYTWSVFSFSHGLIPAFIAIYIIKLNMKE